MIQAVIIENADQYNEVISRNKLKGFEAFNITGGYNRFIRFVTIEDRYMQLMTLADTNNYQPVSFDEFKRSDTPTKSQFIVAAAIIVMAIISSI